MYPLRSGHIHGEPPHVTHHGKGTLLQGLYDGYGYLNKKIDILENGVRENSTRHRGTGAGTGGFYRTKF